MATYRVGIIGCGGIGRDHARAYTTIPGVEIVAGAEINAENATRFTEQFGTVRIHEDYREMLAREELDLVSVCTWPPTHCDATVAAAESGVRGIMCEKPMATNLGEADRMLGACDAHGTRLAVGHQHRFDPQSVKARPTDRRGRNRNPSALLGALLAGPDEQRQPRNRHDQLFCGR